MVVWHWKQEVAGMLSAEDGVGRQVGAAVGVGRCEGYMAT
jgi:hypothetical protein